MSLKLLTETELELMQIIWRVGGATVHEVLQALPAERPLAYTSVSTILRILEQKGFVRSEKVGRGHSYVPLLTKVEYEGRSLGNMVSKVFQGEPSVLVKRLLEVERLSLADLTSIRAMLDEKERLL